MKTKDITKAALIAAPTITSYLSSILDPFLQQNPIWQGVFYSALGLYGVYMAYNQEEVNEIIQFIGEHPEEFREEIVESKEFRKGFLIFIEQYLKQRLDKKKKLLKKLLLGYSVAADKKNYELERLNDCLLRISPESVEFLLFIKEKILPMIDMEIDKELEQDTYSKSDRSKEWWHREMQISKSVWVPIDKWIYENYSPNTNKVKEDYKQELQAGWLPDLLHRAQTREQEKRTAISENMNELVTLGVMKTRTAFNGTDYIMTNFGIQFMDLVSR